MSIISLIPTRRDIIPFLANETIFRCHEKKCDKQIQIDITSKSRQEFITMSQDWNVYGDHYVKKMEEIVEITSLLAQCTPVDIHPRYTPE